MNVKFCLAFPCEAVSVPVMRRVLGDTLRNLGVVDECVGDILVAVTEACTNVLRHGGSARRYEVVTNVGPSGCLVEVVDSGQGFSPRAAAAAARADGDHAVQPAERAGSRDARAQAPRAGRAGSRQDRSASAGGKKAVRRKPRSRRPGSRRPAGEGPSRGSPAEGWRSRARARRAAPHGPGTAGRPYGSSAIRATGGRPGDRPAARVGARPADHARPGGRRHAAERPWLRHRGVDAQAGRVAAGRAADRAFTPQAARRRLNGRRPPVTSARRRTATQGQFIWLVVWPGHGSSEQGSAGTLRLCSRRSKRRKQRPGSGWAL